MSSVTPFKYSKNIMWIKVIIEKVKRYIDKKRDDFNTK